MIITEETFHNYSFCGKKYLLDIKNQKSEKEIELIKFITKELIENNNTTSIPELVKIWINNQSSIENEKWFLLKAPQEIINIYNKIRLEYLSFFKYFNIEKTITINTLNIKVQIPYIAKTESGAYRGICFTHLQNKNDILWSPFHMEEYTFLRDLYIKDKYINGVSAKLFLIGFNKQKKNFFVHSIKKNYKNKSHNLLFDKIHKDISNNLFLPRFPCLYTKCSYYEDCVP